MIARLLTRLTCAVTGHDPDPVLAVALGEHHPLCRRCLTAVPGEISSEREDDCG